MKGKGIAFGAVSVVNAIATGKGAAIGTELKTEAEVELVEKSDRIDVEIIGSNNEEDKILARCAVKEVLEYLEYEGYGARVTTRSEVPIGKGLKSSSMASNSIVLATVAALKMNLDDLDIINLGVNASLKAGVTITGAFDDACASYFGGLILTNNTERRIEKREVLAGDYRVVLYIPPEKALTRDVNKVNFQKFGSLFEEAYSLAINGLYWDAMILNGLLSSAAMGFNTKPVLSALLAGATSVGLSGTGPSIAAICPPDKVWAVTSAWSHLPGEVMCTKVNYEKARLVPLD
jgi:shikimate kinase